MGETKFYIDSAFAISNIARYTYLDSFVWTQKVWSEKLDYEGFLLDQWSRGKVGEFTYTLKSTNLA